MKRFFSHPVLNVNVVVCALGYFVDIYDLLLFSIVRSPSLLSLGVPKEELLSTGVHLINMQMTGLLLGGILWGVLGDRRGRISVLFGSIILYSVANLLNGFVHSIESYGILRFLAGVGLAGELGAAITLVSETLTKENRGYGTALVAGIGVLGAMLAAVVAESFQWRTAYIIGGLMGFALLIARVSMFESSMFTRAMTSQEGVTRGNFFSLFNDWGRFKRYIACIFVGLPIWFVIGILVTFSPEIAQALDTQGPVLASKAVLWSYFGFSFGDIGSGFLSQKIGSRKKVLYLFLGLMTALVAVNSVFRGMSVPAYYGFCFCLGFAGGYWAVFMTVSSEQFGTNLRATVTTTAPNFVRGSLVLVSSGFQALKPAFGLIGSAMSVGFATLALAFIACFALKESYDRDLDFLE